MNLLIEMFEDISRDGVFLSSVDRLSILHCINALKEGIVIGIQYRDSFGNVIEEIPTSFHICRYASNLNNISLSNAQLDRAWFLQKNCTWFMSKCKGDLKELKRLLKTQAEKEQLAEQIVER